MKNLKYIYSVFLLCFSTALFSQNDSIALNQIDGPYVFHTKDGVELVRVNESGVSVEKQSANLPFMVSCSKGEHQFEVKLHAVSRPEWQYEQVKKMLIISDPHGNMDAFVSVLKAQKIINKKYKWAFGKGHLLIIGDVFDRGEDVLPIFWLIYKLEYEAEKDGGKVHFLLGNHEEMVLRNNVKYVRNKYTDLAQKIGKQHSQMWQNNSELGHWLSTRNTIELIGDNLFVHAGLSKEFLQQNWAIPQLNDTVSKYIRYVKTDREKSASAAFLLGSNGPLWYRGMVRDDEKYNPIADEDVDAILNKYNVKRIYVGHTIFKDVKCFYNGKVIGVNVDNKKNKDRGGSRGILINKDKVVLIFDEQKKYESINCE